MAFSSSADSDYHWAGRHMRVRRRAGHCAIPRAFLRSRTAGRGLLARIPRMKKIFRDADGRLRNGWWIALFVVLLAASSFLYTPVSRALRAAGANDAWLQPLPILFLLMVTWAVMRARRERLA